MELELFLIRSNNLIRYYEIFGLLWLTRLRSIAKMSTAHDSDGDEYQRVDPMDLFGSDRESDDDRRSAAAAEADDADGDDKDRNEPKKGWIWRTIYIVHRSMAD